MLLFLFYWFYAAVLNALRHQPTFNIINYIASALLNHLGPIRYTINYQLIYVASIDSKLNMKWEKCEICFKLQLEVKLQVKLINYGRTKIFSKIGDRKL